MIRFPLDHPHRDGGIILARQRKAQRLVELTDARRPFRELWRAEGRSPMIRFPLDHPHRDGGIILARQRKAQRLVELTDARRPRRAGGLRSPGRTWNRRHTRSPHSGARAAFRALLHRRKHHSPALRALRRAPVVQCRPGRTWNRRHTRSPHSGARAAFRALLHRRKHHSPALRALRRAPVVQCRRSETHSRKPLFPRLYRARRLSENHAEPDEITARTKAAWAFSPDLR